MMAGGTHRRRPNSGGIIGGNLRPLTTLNDNRDGGSERCPRSDESDPVAERREASNNICRNKFPQMVKGYLQLSAVCIK